MHRIAVISEAEVGAEVFTLTNDACAIACDRRDVMAVSRWDCTIAIFDRTGAEVTALAAGEGLTVGSLSFEACAPCGGPAGRWPEPFDNSTATTRQ